MTDLCSEFDRLVSDYYHAWFHYHPEAAVEVGVDGYADRLTPHDDDDIGALVSLNEMLMGALDEINEGALDAERRIDYQILYGAALIEHHELLEQDWRRRDPGRFLPVHAVYQLTVRPVKDFAAVLMGRVARVPAHLRSARHHLAELPELIPTLWLESAIIEAQQGAGYFRRLPSHPKLVRAFSSRGRITQLLEDAAHALEDFAHFLEAELACEAAGDFACGRAHFERILRYRHFLEPDADHLHDFGVQLFDTTLRDLKDATRRLRGDEDVAAMTAQIQADHPQPEMLLSIYREQMQTAYRFVQQRELVSLPDKHKLLVVETPEFLRHRIPFAAYMEPAPNDPEQRGYYYVTPAATEAALGEHNVPGLMHTCVHEAWPGHHLQFVTANLRPASRTLPRLLNPSATLYEGWALYCEQLMREQGFLDRPEQEFILLRDRLWRALRVQLDVELQTRGLPVERAAERMQQALGFPPEQAMADLLWYTHAPGVPLGYATGWALITAAREQSRLEDADFTLKTFHDRLLASGSVPLPLALQHGFGSELWSNVRDRGFAA